MASNVSYLMGFQLHGNPVLFRMNTVNMLRMKNKNSSTNHNCRSPNLQWSQQLVLTWILKCIQGLGPKKVRPLASCATKLKPYPMWQQRKKFPRETSLSGWNKSNHRFFYIQLLNGAWRKTTRDNLYKCISLKEKICWFNFHWSLSIRVQLLVSNHWFW